MDIAAFSNPDFMDEKESSTDLFTFQPTCTSTQFEMNHQEQQELHEDVQFAEHLPSKHTRTPQPIFIATSGDEGNTIGMALERKIEEEPAPRDHAMSETLSSSYNPKKIFHDDAPALYECATIDDAISRLANCQQNSSSNANELNLRISLSLLGKPKAGAGIFVLPDAPGSIVPSNSVCKPNASTTTDAWFDHHGVCLEIPRGGDSSMSQEKSQREKEVDASSFEACAPTTTLLHRDRTAEDSSMIISDGSGTINNRFRHGMNKSFASAQALRAWSKAHGLPKSCSKTLTRTNRSREKLHLLGVEIRIKSKTFYGGNAFKKLKTVRKGSSKKDTKRRKNTATSFMASTLGKRFRGTAMEKAARTA